MKKEIWRWVRGHENRIEISSMGNVRSCLGVGRNSGVLKTPKSISPCKDPRGYYNFTVRKNHKPMTVYVHREMAILFIPNPKKYKLVRHLNDIKTDNRLDNLAWGDHVSNRQDAIRNGAQYHEIGARPVKAKLTPENILFIMSSSKNNCELGRMLGVTESAISKVRTGRGWNKITKLPLKK